WSWHCGWHRNALGQDVGAQIGNCISGDWERIGRQPGVIFVRWPAVLESGFCACAFDVAGGYWLGSACYIPHPGAGCHVSDGCARLLLPLRFTRCRPAALLCRHTPGSRRVLAGASTRDWYRPAATEVLGPSWRLRNPWLRRR